MVYPFTDPCCLLPAAPRRIHVRSMSQPTKASSAGNEGGWASPSVSRPVGPIAIEGEGGLAYFHKMMAEGGPGGPGESELQAFCQVLIYTNPLNSFIWTQYPPTARFAKTSNSCQPISNPPVSRFRNPTARLNSVCYESGGALFRLSESVSRRRQRISSRRRGA